MLKKIIKIKNVGKFGDYNASGDLSLKPLNLVYSGNGKGKSTLADVLRSLSRHNPDMVLGRKTIGSEGEPEIELRVN